MKKFLYTILYLLPGFMALGFSFRVTQIENCGGGFLYGLLALILFVLAGFFIAIEVNSRE